MSKAGVKKFFVWSDTQIEEHDPHAIEIALKRLADVRPDYFINIGDFIDNTCLMGKLKEEYVSFSAYNIADLKSQYRVANAYLDKIESLLPKTCKKVFMMGNHEHRSYEVLERIRDPRVRREMGQFLNPEVAMALSKRGYIVKRYNDYWKMGKLYFTHGAFHNEAHAKKHLQDYQKSICYGHMHTIDMETHHTPMREVALQAISVGCLAKINPMWRRNRPNAYDHAFAEGYVNSGGSFWIYINRIIKGVLIAADGSYYK